MGLLTPDLGYFVWALIIFLILLFILKKFAWKPIIKMLNEREQIIAGSIATAEKIKAEMAQLQNENEALLAKAREERAQLLKEARETKEKIINCQPIASATNPVKAVQSVYYGDTMASSINLPIFDR